MKWKQIPFNECKILTIKWKGKVSHLIRGVWLCVSGVVSSGWCAIFPSDHIQTEVLGIVKRLATKSKRKQNSSIKPYLQSWDFLTWRVYGEREANAENVQTQLSSAGLGNQNFPSVTTKREINIVHMTARSLWKSSFSVTHKSISLY